MKGIVHAHSTEREFGTYIRHISSRNYLRQESAFYARGEEILVRIDCSKRYWERHHTQNNRHVARRQHDGENGFLSCAT